MIITTVSEYDLALHDLEELSDAQVGTPDGYRYEALSQALDEYDAQKRVAPLVVAPDNR